MTSFLKSSQFSAMCRKLEIGLRGNVFPEANNYFSKSWFQNELEGNNKRICSLFRCDTVYPEIDFTTYGLHRDHQQAWEFIK